MNIKHLVEKSKRKEDFIQLYFQAWKDDNLLFVLIRILRKGLIGY